MLTHIAAYLAGAGTMFAVAVTLGARWRGKRRRVDALHAEMLRAVWNVQDQAAMITMDPPKTSGGWIKTLDYWQDLQIARDAAAARYFAAVGE